VSVEIGKRARETQRENTHKTRQKVEVEVNAPVTRYACRRPDKRYTLVSKRVRQAKNGAKI
jgi:hypothetical protein